MVTGGHQGGHEVYDDRTGNEVEPFPYGVWDPSGPGAEEGEDLARVWVISSLERGRAEGALLRRPLQGMMPLRGKKWSCSTLVIVTGSEASRRERNLGAWLWVTSCLAVQMVFGEVLARRSTYYEALCHK